MILIAIAVSACNKDGQDDNIDNTKIVSPYIEYYAEGIKDLDVSGNIRYTTKYNAYAHFKHGNAFQNAGTLDIGTMQLFFNPDTKRYAFAGQQTVDSVNAKNFGTNTRIAISGGGIFTPIATSLYIPKVIYLDTAFTNFPGEYPEIKVNSLPYRIRWNADTSNVYPNNTNNVDVFVSYKAPITKDQPYSPIVKTRSSVDIGFFDITSDMLSHVPIGDTLTIYLQRLNTTIMRSNDVPIYINAYSISERKFVLLQ